MTANEPAVWVGTYTAELGGSGRGIERLPARPGARAGDALPAASPAFVAAHPFLPVLYAVEESTGDLLTVDLTGERMRPLAPAAHACDLPCHVHVAPNGRYLLVSGWGDGVIAMFELTPSGSPRLIRRVRAAGPAPSRVHCSATLGDGRIATVDMANDSIGVWRIDETSGLVPEQTVEFPPGSGPRHLKVHGNGLVYVVTEHSGQVFALRTDHRGRFAIAGSAPLRPNGPWAAPDLAAELTLFETVAGTVIHVGVRGSDSIVTVRVYPDGVSMNAVDEVSSHGLEPRHHAVDRDRLYVANRVSDSLAVFDIDPAGRLTHRHDLPVGSPSCVATR